MSDEDLQHEIEEVPVDEEVVEQPADDEEVAEPPAEGEDDEPKLSRGQQRMQKLANERTEALAEAKVAREQAEFYRQQAAARQAPVEPEYVDPDEQWRRSTESRINQALATAEDMKDQAAYMRQAVKNPLYGKYEDRVEAELKSTRARGGNATREGILAYLVGKDALNANGKPTKAAAQAAIRVSAAKTTTPGVKSNVSAQRSNDASLEERLRDIVL